VSAPRAPRALVILLAVGVACGFGQFGAVSSLGDVARHFGAVGETRTVASVVGLSTTVLGLGLGILRLSSLFSMPLSALADRRGRVRMLRRLVVLGLCATALAAASPNYWFFVGCFAVARPLLSASGSLLQVLVVEVSSAATRVANLAALAAAVGSGAGLSAVLHGFLRGGNSFRELFILAIVPALVLRPLVKRLPEPAYQASAAELQPALGWVPASLRGHLAILGVVAFLVGVITGPANGFAFVYGENILHITPRVVAMVVAGSAFTGLAGLWLSRSLTARLGRRLTVACGALATAATSTMAYFGGATLFTLGYLVGVAAAALLAPAAAALTTEIFPHRFRATANGWVVVAGVLGATAGLIGFGMLAAHEHGVVASQSLRLPALLTFVPLLPLLVLVRRLPDLGDREVD
jgi:MFS family permease